MFLSLTAAGGKSQVLPVPGHLFQDVQETSYPWSQAGHSDTEFHPGEQTMRRRNFLPCLSWNLNSVNQPCWTTSPGSHPTEHLWIQEKETWDSGISVSREVPPSDIPSHRTHHDSSPPPQLFEEQRKMFLQDFCLPGVKTWEQIFSQGMAKRRRVGKAGAFPGGEVPSERSI